MTHTRPDPHASYLEHVSSEAEAVEEIGIVERLRFDAVRCEIQFSKGVARNISEAADEIESLRVQLATTLTEKLELANHIDGCVRVAADALKRADAAESQLATARRALRAVRPLVKSFEWQSRPYRDLLDQVDAALNSGEQKQIEDWPYPEGNPTCPQDLK